MVKRIEFFDCGKEIDLQKAESIMKEHEVLTQQVVQFPYLMVVWNEK